MTIGLALGLIALLLSLWAINWASRAANAAERAAAAAEKSAVASERNALAAQRRADAAATTSRAAEPAQSKPEPNYEVSTRARTERLDALVKELMNTWPQEKSAWPLVERHPTLADEEVEEVIEKALYLMGHTEDEARQHAVAVLNLRHDRNS